MNTDAEMTYMESIQALNQMMSASSNEMASWDDFDYTQIDDIPSNLDGYDYCFSIAIGLAGTFISTSDELAEYLEKIHKLASDSKPKSPKNLKEFKKMFKTDEKSDFLQKFLGFLLNHKGDDIDKVAESCFKTRKGTNAFPIFHRLLWGHDILSFGADNPFYLMFQQKGVAGILQALRHLTADTMSSQGLPMPGSSWLDYTTEDGKVSNYLIKVCQNLSQESMAGKKNSAEKIYSHMFTIRAQDMMGGAAVGILSKVYYAIRGYDDEIRKAQFNLIAYSVSFFAQAIVGAIRQGGIPYVNIPLLCATLKHLVGLYLLSGKETKHLELRTDELIAQGDQLETMVLATGQMIGTCESADDFIDEMDQAERNVDDLVAYFEEG